MIIEHYQQLWQERREQLEGSQAAARAVIEALGGKPGGSLQLANILYAELPARSVVSFLRTGIALGIEYDPTQDSLDAEGIERRRALVMNDDGLQSWGWDGAQGAKSGGGNRVRFAVIEAETSNTNSLNWSSYAWNQDSGSTNRLLGIYECGSGCGSPPYTSTSGYHGTWVSSVLVGDFEDGQDKAGWSTTLRQQRGGIASEGQFIYRPRPRRRGSGTGGEPRCLARR